MYYGILALWLATAVFAAVMLLFFGDRGGEGGGGGAAAAGHENTNRNGGTFMSSISEARLPGVGRKFQVEAASGDRLTVIVHDDGRRELYHFTRENPESLCEKSSSDRNLARWEPTLAPFTRSGQRNRVEEQPETTFHTGSYAPVVAPPPSASSPKRPRSRWPHASPDPKLEAEIEVVVGSRETARDLIRAHGPAACRQQLDWLPHRTCDDKGALFACAVTPNGMTLLMHAAHCGRTQAARLLIEHGADVNAVTKRGSTALTYTAESRDGNPEAARLLLAWGADVDAANGSGMTTLMLASASDRSLEAVCVLLDAGADVNLADNNGMTALH